VTNLTVQRGAELLDGLAAVLMLSDADGLLQVRAVHGHRSAPELQTLAFEPEADAVVMAEHSRLRQVLVNLIGNAIKFTPASGSIAVQTSLRHEPDGPFVDISVRDTGPGVPESEQASIYEPYYRSSTTAHVEGVGLGLAISRALIAQMNGALLLDSEPGSGACFTIRLPCVD
jgi:signal transduction histidine kinase